MIHIRYWAMALALILSNYVAALDEPDVPPPLGFGVLQLPELAPPDPYIPDIPWNAPVARPNPATPFAPKFLKGNNLFTGEKEYWLADVVSGTSAAWPKRFNDPPICNYLNHLIANLGLYSHEPGKHYDVQVVDLSYDNAFTAGGGHIYITRQMLRGVISEDELVGILAHEMGHDNFHHAGRTMTRQFFWVIGVSKVESYEDLKQDFAKWRVAYDPEYNPFPALGESISGIARADEQAADKAAFYFLYRAGYNPLALAEYFHRVPDPNIAYLKQEIGSAWPIFWTISLAFDSHPPNAWREAAARWESNFVGSFPKDARVDSTAFDAMKTRLKYLDAIDAEKARKARDQKDRLNNKPTSAQKP